MLVKDGTREKLNIIFLIMKNKMDACGILQIKFAKYKFKRKSFFNSCQNI